MEGLDPIQAISNVGGVVGVPAALLLFWIFNKVKELVLRVEQIEHENVLLKQTLSDIRSDVSYIKGKLEDK